MKKILAFIAFCFALAALNPVMAQHTGNPGRGEYKDNRTEEYADRGDGHRHRRDHDDRMENRHGRHDNRRDWREGERHNRQGFHEGRRRRHGECARRDRRDNHWDRKDDRRDWKEHRRGGRN